MEAAEHLYGEVKRISAWGNEFPIKFYMNPEGYVGRDGNKILCRSCKQAPAVHRLEIYNHIYEPQGSEYYCDNHAPKPIQVTSE